MNRYIHLVSALSLLVIGLHAQTYTLKDLGTLGGKKFMKWTEKGKTVSSKKVLKATKARTLVARFQ